MNKRLAQTERLLKEECDKYGLPTSLSALLRHLKNNHAATLGAKDYSLRYVTETLKLLRDFPSRPAPADGVAEQNIVDAEWDAEHKLLLERVDRVIRAHEKPL